MMPVPHLEPVHATTTAALDATDVRQRLADAEEMLRSIGAGEVDAFVISDGAEGQRVFTLSTADRPYRMFVENMRDAAATLSANGLVLYANRRLAEMLACSKDTIVGSPISRFIADDSSSSLVGALRDQRGLGATFELELLNADGQRVPVLVGVSPLTSEDDDLTCVTFADLTAQKLIDEERARLEGRLNQAIKMESVGRLAGGVAHDFNNMLSVILGQTELAMRHTGVEPEVLASLSEIHDAAERSAELTRHLLAFARQQTVQPAVLDLNRAASQVLPMLQRLIGEDVALTWRPGADLWPLRIDPSQVDQILTNLCVNARDAIAGIGRIDLTTANVAVDAATCALHHDAAAGDYVRLTVSDTGGGMDEPTMANIFEPFFTTKDVGRGTGLGLASVYGAVTQNAGFITVSSVLGAGASFEIYLPRHVGEIEPEAVVQPLPVARRSGETILVVEDERAIRSLVVRILAAEGYTVLAADCATTAIGLAVENADRIRLVVTDVVMPDMTGRDLANRLSSLGIDVRVLYMSGYPAALIAERGVLEEGVAFIQKPFSIDALVAKARETLDAEQTPPSALARP